MNFVPPLDLCLLADGPAAVVQIVLGVRAPEAIPFQVLLLAVGLVAITKGGDLFTDSAVAIARATRVPAVIVGATIVSMATTFPEFMVSLTGALQGTPGFAVGNALGSCCCNIGLIVGTCAVVQGYLERTRGGPGGIPTSRFTLRGAGAFMLAAAVLVWVFAFFDNGGAVDDGQPVRYAIARWQGIALSLVLGGYLVMSLRMALHSRSASVLEEMAEPQPEEAARHLPSEIGTFVLGAIVVALGSRLLVTNAETIALEMGVSELVVGLTILAVGTSLPEFTISLLAVLKGHEGLGIGNILGANVLNITWVVATCAMISPLPIEPQTIYFDTPVVLLLMGLLIGLAWPRERISPAAGWVLCSIYVAYITVLVTVFSGR